MDAKGFLNKFKANATLILADKIVVNEFKTFLKIGSFLWIQLTNGGFRFKTRFY
jgi:hypothetical protein